MGRNAGDKVQTVGGIDAPAQGLGWCEVGVRREHFHHHFVTAVVKNITKAILLGRIRTGGGEADVVEVAEALHLCVDPLTTTVRLEIFGTSMMFYPQIKNSLNDSCGLFVLDKGSSFELRKGINDVNNVWWIIRISSIFLVKSSDCGLLIRINSILGSGTDKTYWIASGIFIGQLSNKYLAASHPSSSVMGKNGKAM